MYQECVNKRTYNPKQCAICQIFFTVSKKTEPINVILKASILTDYFFVIARCTSNCKKLKSRYKFEKVSQLRNLIVDTKCIGRPCPTISSYRWNVFTEQRNSVNGSWWRKVENLYEFIEGFRQRSLILTRLMQIGNRKTRNQRIKIRATIKITINRTILEEEDELTLELNSPPRPVESNTEGCELTPSYGKAWETNFHIKCGKWYDEDGVDSFEFRYKRFSNIVIIKKGPESTASTRLPRGIKEANDTMYVQIKIYDKAEDYTMITRKAKVSKSRLSNINFAY